MTKEEIYVVTHDGKFHCDEVSAIAILSIIYNIKEIVRTRVEEHMVLMTNNSDNLPCFFIDVGEQYCHILNQYDHHQKSFNEKFRKNSPSAMSSAGLVYKHYGHRLIKEIMDLYDVDENSIDKVSIFYTFYKKFIMPIDANDNDIYYCNSNKYIQYNPITLQTIISDYSEDKFDDAVNLIKEIIIRAIDSLIVDNIGYYHNYQTLIKHKNLCEKSSTLIINEFIEGKSISRFLNDHNKNKQWKFVISPRNEDCSKWQVWTVNKDEKQFSKLIPLISEDNAKKIFGDDILFIHKNRFIGMTTNFDTAAQLVAESYRQWEYKKYKLYYGIGLGCILAAGLASIGIGIKILK